MPQPAEGDVREGWIVFERFPDYRSLEEKLEYQQLVTSQRVTNHRILSGFTWAVLDDEQIAREVSEALAKVWAAYVPEGISRDRLDSMGFGPDAARPRRVRCYFGQTDPSIPSDVTTADKDVVVRYVD